MPDMTLSVFCLAAKRGHDFTNRNLAICGGHFINMTLSIPARIAVHDFINDGLVDKAMYRTLPGPGPGRGPPQQSTLSIQGAYICGHFGGLNVN